MYSSGKKNQQQSKFRVKHALKLSLFVGENYSLGKMFVGENFVSFLLYCSIKVTSKNSPNLSGEWRPAFTISLTESNFRYVFGLMFFLDCLENLV